MIYVAPTEPPQLRLLGETRREAWGCDVVIEEKVAVGIQRKTVADLVASLEDGRLQRDIMEMRAGVIARELDAAVLLVEGDLKSVSARTRWTDVALRKILWHAQAKGLWVERTRRLGETCDVVRWMAAWAEKPTSKTLETKPKDWRGTGFDPKKERGVWMIQTLPGIGPELAARIYEEVGVPFTLSVDEKKLLSVKGLGKGKLEAIKEMFDDESGGAAEDGSGGSD